MRRRVLATSTGWGEVSIVISAPGSPKNREPYVASEITLVTGGKWSCARLKEVLTLLKAVKSTLDLDPVK